MERYIRLQRNIIIGDIKMNKGTGIILVLLIFIAGIAGALYLGNKMNSYPALKMTISTNLTEDDNTMVNNITIEQTTVPFYYRRVDSPNKFPDVYVYARANAIASAPISYWASSFRADDNPSNYTLMVLFRDGKEPVPGDKLLLRVGLTNFRGDVEYKTTAFYIWKDLKNQTK